MNEIEISEQMITATNGQKVGKLAILRGSPSLDNPSQSMQEAVYKYVGYRPYNEFIEIHLDNPWVRVIVSGINELNYEPFEDQKL